MPPSAHNAPIRPVALIIMGVSGSGKSTLGKALGEQLACPFLEGDDYHSAAAVAKMHAGHPLTDADRWPWLDRLGAATAAAVARGGLAVTACSALRRCYRERLIAAIGQPTRFVLLDNPREELRRRIAGRPTHYMPTSLLDSQLETLERPAADEAALTLDAGAPVTTLCDTVLRWLAAPGGSPA